MIWEKPTLGSDPLEWYEVYLLADLRSLVVGHCGD
jgi:hypothetical protein